MGQDPCAASARGGQTVLAHTPTNLGTTLRSSRTELPQETSRSKHHIPSGVGHLGPRSHSKTDPLMLTYPTASDHSENTEPHPRVYVAEALTLSKVLERLCCLLLHKWEKKKEKPSPRKKKPPKDVTDTLSQLQRHLILSVQHHGRIITS